MDLDFTDRLWHSGTATFDARGKVTGFRSNETGVLYGPGDLEKQDVWVMESEHDADICQTYFEDIEIEHEFTVRDGGDVIEIDGNKADLCEAHRNKVIDNYNYHVVWG